MIEELSQLQNSPQGMTGLMLAVILIVLVLGMVFRISPLGWLARFPPISRFGRWLAEEHPERAALCFGVLFLLLTVSLLAKPVRLAVAGKSASGIVVSVTQKVWNPSADPKEIWFTATIQFQADNRLVRIERTWHRGETPGSSRCVVGCFQEGEKPEIHYFPDDPADAEVGSFFTLLLPALLAALCAGLAFKVWHVNRSRRIATDPRYSGPAVL